MFRVCREECGERERLLCDAHYPFPVPQVQWRRGIIGVIPSFGHLCIDKGA